MQSGRWLCGVLVCSLVCLVGWGATRREREVALARFVTSLRDRTPNQVHNVTLAAHGVHGRWLRPGEVFSFNGAVGSWSADRGYRRAPVSYDGELVPSWGGGVCQASTTLYNAALLAGLTVTERHRHRWTASYAAPGRDAAVAFSNIDLKFRNDHPWPVRLEARVRGSLIDCRVIGPRPLPVGYAIRQRVEAVTEPALVRQPWRDDLPARRVRNPGKRGWRVLTYRVRIDEGRETGRELLSDDAYPAMNRLVLDDRRGGRARDE